MFANSFSCGVPEKEFFMKKKSTLIIAIVAVFLLLTVLTAWLVFKPSANADVKSVTVNVVHGDGSETGFVITGEAEYLREMLEPAHIISGREDTYGLWVTTVDGETADESKQQWWGYTVNGEMSMYGVETQPVNDGDVIEFTLNEGY